MNPIDFKHRIAGQPYRLGRRAAGPTIDNDPEMLVALMGAFYTAGLNLATPAVLIQSGYRGERYFSGITYAKNAIGWPMPIFHYITPGSPAEKAGARMGRTLGSFLFPALHDITSTGVLGKTRTLVKGGASGARVGAKIGARVGGRLIPGVGWALLAYDVYDVAYNRSLWGFDLS